MERLTGEKCVLQSSPELFYQPSTRSECHKYAMGRMQGQCKENIALEMASYLQQICHRPNIYILYGEILR